MFKEMEVTIRIDCFGLTIMVDEVVEYIGFLESENPYHEIDHSDLYDDDLKSDLDDWEEDND